MLGLVAVALLAAAAPAPSPEAAAPKVLRLARPSGGDWLGLYLQGRKAGSWFSDVREDTWQNERAVRSETRLRLVVDVSGKPVERRFEEQRWYAWKDGGRLLGFTARQTGDGGDMTIRGTCTPAGCKVTVTAGGTAETKALADPGETVEYADPVRLVAADRTELRLPFIDLNRLEPRVQVTRIVGVEERTEGGKKISVARVGSRDTKETLETVADVASDGRILVLTNGAAMRGVAQSESEANGSMESIDILDAGKVVLPSAVSPGSREVSLVLTGLPPALRQTDDRQRFEDLGGGKVRVTLRARAPTKKARLPVDRAAFETDLATTLAIDHDAPAVRALAHRVVPAPGGDAFQQSSELVAWVHGSVRTVLGQSSDRASRVAVGLAGDCTEHALLFTALARATGLPARLVYGLVSTGDDGGRALYWHEWAEVWTGEWIAVDPTFGQSVADATHLALGRGDDLSAITLLGQLHVLEASAR